MAHAIGCLGSAVQTYRREKKAAARRATKRGKLRNQNRKMAVVVVSHDGGKTFRGVKCRQGHLHHVRAAFLYADVVEYTSRAIQQ